LTKIQCILAYMIGLYGKLHKTFLRYMSWSIFVGPFPKIVEPKT